MSDIGRQSTTAPAEEVLPTMILTFVGYLPCTLKEHRLMHIPLLDHFRHGEWIDPSDASLIRNEAAGKDDRSPKGGEGG